MEDLIDHWEDLKAVALDQQRQAEQVQVSGTSEIKERFDNKRFDNKREI